MTSQQQAGFEVLTAVVMKISVFRDITICILVKVSQCFGGTYHLLLQDQRVSQARDQYEAGGKQNER
jgi:hypothetical protein